MNRFLVGEVVKELLFASGGTWDASEMVLLNSGTPTSLGIRRNQEENFRTAQVMTLAWVCAPLFLAS